MTDDYTMEAYCVLCEEMTAHHLDQGEVICENSDTRHREKFHQ